MQERRRTRLAAYDYATAGAYFITACAKDRRCLFGEVIGDRVALSANGRIVAECWHDLPHHHSGIDIDAFVVMPNHVHGIIFLTPRARQASPLHVVVGGLKSGSSRRANRPLWQRGYHDRVIRDDAELTALRQYIADNPLRWALDRENPARA